MSMSLKERMRGRETLVGAFIKTPSPLIMEVLGRTELDFLLPDQEHAPFDALSLDACLLAARATGKPCLVRVPTARPEEILKALDSGATGILVSHTRSVDEARAIVRAATYLVPEGRGYAGTTRAADYGKKSMRDHLRDAASSVTVLATIEDASSVDIVEEIAAVDGLDGLFIGPMDLTVAMGEPGPDSPRMQEAFARICRAAAGAGIGVGIYLGDDRQVEAYKNMGITFFLLGSDHTFLYAGAAGAVSAVRRESLFT